MRPLKYFKKIILKDGRECVLRNGTQRNGEASLEVFKKTHKQTDFLLTYPDEISFTVEDQEKYMKEKDESGNEVELLAELDGKIVGTAGIDAVGRNYKTRRRAEFGIGIDKAYWGLGIGSALTRACIECAKRAGYSQLELEVVADNKSALSLYNKLGFVEYGRNPRGFMSRQTGWQELVLMRLELD